MNQVIALALLTFSILCVCLSQVFHFLCMPLLERQSCKDHYFIKAILFTSYWFFLCWWNTAAIFLGYAEKLDSNTLRLRTGSKARKKQPRIFFGFFFFFFFFLSCQDAFINRTWCRYSSLVALTFFNYLFLFLTSSRCWETASFRGKGEYICLSVVPKWTLHWLRVHLSQLCVCVCVWVWGGGGC